MKTRYCRICWRSIDSDESCDLDQLTVTGALPGNLTKILVAIADTYSVVGKASAIDDHACYNTTL